MTIIKEITSILNNEQTSLGEKLSMLRGVLITGEEIIVLLL
mgnify:CR=1 FL=1